MSEPMQPMQFRVLGPLTAHVDGTAVALGGPRQRLTLALLLVDAGRTVSIEHLIDGMWSDDPPERARHTVQAYVSELRRLLHTDLEWTGYGYRLGADSDDIDARRFEDMVGAARGLGHRQPTEAAATLREALALWRGDPFADLAHEEALQPEIRRLVEVRLGALEDRVDVDLVLGLHRNVVDELDVLTREHPLRERLHGLHMLALYRCGRQAESLRAFQRARTTLVEELGIEPSPELQALHQRILDQDVTLESSTRTTGSPSDGPVDDADLAFAVRGFELRERVKEGEIGVVFRALQASTGRDVAIMKVHPAIADDVEFVRRFESEAQAIARLEHPHIIALQDYWRGADGTYLVMPWMSGGNLDAVLGGSAPVPGHIAWTVIDHVGSALAYAHREGVVHGSITPRNILFDADGNAYLSDFGIGPARAAAPSPTNAPETVEGAAPTVRSDVYQFGMLIGRMLGTESEPQLATVLEQATVADATRRFTTISDLVDALRGAAVVPASVTQTRPARSARPRNPYAGLRPFTEADADDFHGRTDEIDRVVHAVTRHPVVAVVGPSGIGKTSLVHAGVVPALRARGGEPGRPDDGRWLVTDMVPGRHPLESLVAAIERIAVGPVDDLLTDLTLGDHGLVRACGRALPDDGSRLLIVIDRFDEVVSPTTEVAIDPDERRAFVEMLAATANDPRAPVTTIITLRGEALGPLLEHQRFGPVLQPGIIPIAAMRTESLASVIERPARDARIDIEPELVTSVLLDASDRPGLLPDLQHVLAELADGDGAAMTERSYRALGGLLSSIETTAEAIFASFDPPEQAQLERLFVQLAAADDTTVGGISLRRVTVPDLVAADTDAIDPEHLLAPFTRHRLVTFAHDSTNRTATVEIAHEVLVRRWKRLRGWIDDRGSERIRTDLRSGSERPVRR